MSDQEDSSSSDSERDEEEETSRPNKKSRLSSIPLEVANTSSTTSAGGKKKQQPPIIILLDQATIETIKNKRGVYELINCDDHRDICKKKLKKDPNEYRPDILHQELLALLDSPLNKIGLVQVYIRTKNNVLIQVHSSIRIPRTYKRFAGLMVQLLHKMKIKAGETNTTLLKVIKNPFSQYLPAGTRCYGMSCNGKLYSPITLAKTYIPEDYNTNNNNSPPICFIVGAMSTGHITLDDHPYIEHMFSISDYPLSGAAALSRIMVGIEHHWGIV